MAGMRRRILRSVFHSAAQWISVKVPLALAPRTGKTLGTGSCRHTAPRISVVTFGSSSDEKGWRSRRLPDCGYARKRWACLHSSPARERLMQAAARLFNQIPEDKRVQHREGEDDHCL